MRWRRRAHQLVLALYACALLGCVAMVVGPLLNDVSIAANPGRAIATVTDAGRMRTFVEYTDEDGRVISPSTGLLYPTGLGEGQQVWVSYSKRDPDLVKVEGRAWTLSIVPALSVWVVSTVLAALAWIGVSRWVPYKNSRDV